jgi:hypothetical protein
MEEEEIGQEFDRVIRAGMMATSNVADTIARRSAEQARVQREAALTEARAAEGAAKRAEQLAREAAHDGRALELANIRAVQATEVEKNRLTREALQVADRSIGRDEWWKNATPARIADTVSLAAEASEKSPLAASVYERMSGKIQDLYGIDLQEHRAIYTMPFAPNQELNRHSGLVDAIDDTLARRREEAEAANARTEAAEANQEAAAAVPPDKNSAYTQFADQEWLENASREQLTDAYAQTAGAAENDQSAFVANGVADALDARFGVVQVIDKTGAPESVKAAVSRSIDEAAADRESPDLGQERGEQRVRAAAAGVRAEQHEDAASEHGISERANMAKSAASQSPAAKLASESFPDSASVALGKAQRHGTAKARVNRGAAKERGAEPIIER